MSDEQNVRRAKKRKRISGWIDTAEAKIKEFSGGGDEAAKKAKHSIDSRDALIRKALASSDLLRDTPLGDVSSANRVPVIALVLGYCGAHIMSESLAFKMEVRWAEDCLDGNGDDTKPVCGQMVPVPESEWEDYRYHPADSGSDSDGPPEEECENNTAPDSNMCYACGVRARHDAGKSIVFDRLRAGRRIIRRVKPVKPDAAPIAMDESV